MEIQQLLAMFPGRTNEDMLEMILSNRIDMGSSGGGLISGAQFPALVQDILAWHASITAPPAASGDESPT